MGQEVTSGRSKSGQAALQSVTQRVEELAAALQSEQQKHHDATLGSSAVLLIQ